MEIKRINTIDTYSIRQKVLRPGRPFDTCFFDHDENDQTFHLGGFMSNKLVSIASFNFNSNEYFAKAKNQYQLQGMATLKGFRKQGLSKELLRMAFPIIKNNFCNLLWCKARTTSQGFYEQVGFESVGEIFEIHNIGSHILMYKKI